MSRSDDLRKRLNALNRQPLGDSDERPPAAEPPETPETDELRRRIRKKLRTRGGRAPSGAPQRPKPSPEPIVLRRDVARRDPPKPPPLPVGPHVTLEEAVDGIQAAAHDGAVAFVVERRVGAASADRLALRGGLADVLEDRRSGLWRQLDYLGIEGPLRPEGLMFLDLETTGLGSSPLFLIGAMVCDEGGLLVRQFFARDYSEERAALALFLPLATSPRLLVTFNGKSFDVPFLRARAAANAMPCDLDPPHLDLLHAGRRIWKHCLPDCRLQTLERHVCGRLRHDDIPGAFIPDAYHDYVRTGNAARMVTVLEHNFLDLVTLADLVVRMPTGPPPGAGG
jgi:uncharacterized protein YprB with RNaseH-like and TPR domain